MQIRCNHLEFDTVTLMTCDSVSDIDHSLSQITAKNKMAHLSSPTLRKLPVKFSLVFYFPCKIVLIYQECGDSACRSHNEITRQRGQINTIGDGLLRTRNSGKIYTVCVIILHGVFCVYAL